MKKMIENQAGIPVVNTLKLVQDSGRKLRCLF
jgi:hypothetical protein